MLSGTTINSNRTKYKKMELKLRDFNSKKVSISYLLKELKTLIRTPIFCLQCLVMPIAYPIFVFLIMYAFINFSRSIGIDALSEFYHRIMTTWGVAIFISIGQVFYMMNFSSIIAVSRESKNSILMKYLPINFEKQLNLKLKIGIITNLVSGIMISMAYYLVVKNIKYSVLIFIILWLINVIGEKIKILVDLRNPQVTWTSEYTMMKQNTNVMYELFYTFMMMIVLIIMSFFFKSPEIYLIFILIVTICTNLLLNEYIHSHQVKLAKKII